MRIRNLHRWDISPKEAMALQAALASQVVAGGAPSRVERIAAADVAYADRRWPRRPSLARAAVAVFAYPGLGLLEQRIVERPVDFPYVPGLLSFREAPALLDAFQAVETEPDLLLVDGQGTLHPRRFGLACHLGLLLGLPTIGCAKSRLCGEPAPLGPDRGATAEVFDGGAVIGLAVRTRRNVAPVYVSPGHLIGLSEAADWVLRLSKTRVPEPLRVADRLSKGCAG